MRLISIDGDYGDVAAYFNVSLISTQAVSRQLDALVRAGTYANTTDALCSGIAIAGSPIRAMLSGQVLDKGVASLPTKAHTEGGICHLALCALTDAQLIAAIKALAMTPQLARCLSNADSSETSQGDDSKTHSHKVSDGTNAATRADLHAAGVPVPDRFVPSGSIGHNKFVVWSNGQGPQEVLTGSTNWTPTGLCSQTNNALVLRSAAITQGYQDYWNRLVQDASLHPAQGPELRAWCGNGPVHADLGQGSTSVWLLPNTTAKTKDAHIAPPDLAQLFELIRRARQGVLFLAFNPGSPSFMEVVRDKTQQMQDDDQPFYVRGALTDATSVGQFSTFITKRNAAAAPDILLCGVAGVPDNFEYFDHQSDVSRDGFFFLASSQGTQP